MGMAKSDRLLYILNLLRSRKNLNASRLAVECEVTERSIYRDIISLSEANVPIYYDNGYKLASDNFLPPLNFDLEEYSCLHLALGSSPLKLSSKHKVILKRIRAKVDAGMPDRIRKKRLYTQTPIHIHISTTQEEKKAERFYSVIEEAITSNSCLEMEYESLESGKSSRIVEPHFIIFRARAFYFVGYCRTRKSFRTFRMDRVKRIKPTSELFNPRSDVRPGDYFKGSWEFSKGEPVQIKVRFTGAGARLVSGGRHHPSETIEQIDDRTVIYCVTVNGLDEIMRWILGFGNQAEVLEPEELRQKLAVVGDHLNQTYRRHG